MGGAITPCEKWVMIVGRSFRETRGTTREMRASASVGAF
jgi:hypothetical protein